MRLESTSGSAQPTTSVSAHGWRGNTTDDELNLHEISAGQLIRGVATPSVGTIRIFAWPPYLVAAEGRAG